MNKARSFREPSIFTEINWAGIVRKRNTIEDVRYQASIVRVPLAGCLVGLAEILVRQPGRRGELVVQQYLQPENLLAPLSLKCFINR